MYVILVYDVDVKRVAKACKTLRRRLNWVQNSVFEGEITDVELKKIKVELAEVLDFRFDSVLIYAIKNAKAMERQTLGPEKLSPSNII